jgi:peptidoglycan/xylan/chitin deacetylase (PgdA/CDA1 family)
MVSKEHPLKNMLFIDTYGGFGFNMKNSQKKIGRREFIRSAGMALISAAAVACQRDALAAPVEPSASPTPTIFKKTLTETPRPPIVFPTATTMFSPDQIPDLLTANEISFIANHEVQEGDTSRPVVMMTYDDNAKYDDVRAILDALNQYNAKATFFFIGEKVIPSSKAVRAIVEDGHTLGCHGYEHINLEELSDSQLNRQIENCFAAVHEVVPGYRMRFIRFPFGNGTSNPHLLSIAAYWGLQHVCWTMGSGGLDNQTYDNVMRNVENGSIVLSHMFRPYDVSQAERIIGNLVEMGYSLEAVDTGRKPGDIYPDSL